VSSAVIFEVSLSCKKLSTTLLGALVRLEPSVGPHMSVEVALLIEYLWALFALEFKGASVMLMLVLFMNYKPSLPRKCLFAT
jgi:hypothetical protein